VEDVEEPCVERLLSAGCSEVPSGPTGGVRARARAPGGEPARKRD
jgi:hypothetical protein